MSSDAQREDSEASRLAVHSARSDFNLVRGVTMIRRGSHPPNQGGGELVEAPLLELELQQTNLKHFIREKIMNKLRQLRSLQKYIIQITSRARWIRRGS
jgi:hypothetical protein